MDSKEKEKESQNKSGVDYSFPISEYAKQLDFPVRDRYLQKIAAIGIDPVLVEGKDFKPDCLPPVESTDILCYLVLETSFYSQKQFKAFRSLEAYNQMVSGFIASVQGHIIADKFLVLAKVRHSQRMNDSLISCWVITEREGTILFAHCLGCKAGLAETCSHIASVLFYLGAWTKINGRLACTQVKCSWLLPTYVKQVEYEKVREINFTSARKMKNDLDAKIENLSNVSSPDNSAKGNVSKEIPVPSKPEMDTFYAKLSKSSSKPIALSLIPEYADSYILKSRCVPTISDLFDKKYLALSYPELLKACQEVDIEITKEQILQVERDTVAQVKGNSFFRHRAGRIGASQSKAACQTNPAMPSQSLIQSICYPELNKLNTKAIIHGCQHEQEAISAYEEIMKKEHINFKIEKCGLMINEEYPWLHATTDFLCSCDCCGEGCGKVKCPLCIENCDFDNYVMKPSSCLEKIGTGNFSLKTNHQYYFQIQQQLFTRKRLYCDFIVCAFGHVGEAKLVTQRHFPDKDHWEAVLPKLTRFWRTCILPEVLGRWYTRKHDFGDVKPMEAHCVCFCRTVTAEDTVSCCNANCPILKFHLSCLGICSIPKTWYCPNLTKPVISKKLKELVEALLGPNFQGISNIPVQQQMNVSDCGVFAIAFATCLVYGQNPCNVIFDIPRMRQHLHRCLRTGMMQLFPTT